MEGVNLKDPRLVRLFISSPFNGMEKERDILTKFYWPQIESALSEKGLHLRLVDMRWGISSSSSSDSQTINICLGEIDRSDIFIGLYGQRYGWNGKNDKDLQDSFDKAAKKYPWVEKYRDKSITELEFLQGHLNNPGNMPSCICFRDKEYDEKMRKDAEKRGDARTQRFYSETKEASEKLDDLKDRVHKTKDKTLGVEMNYKDPEEGAQFIYDCVWKYIEKEIISKIKTPLTEREQTNLAHKSYKSLRCSMYVGGQKYMNELDSYVTSDVDEYHPLTIVGPTGCGKTTLLSNWVEAKLQESETAGNKDMFFYHFVGAESNSVRPRHLMNRLINFVQQILTGEVYESGNRISLSLLVKKTIAVLSTIDQDKRLVIVVDSVNQILQNKESLPLFWLPQKLSSRIKVIVSVTQEDPKTQEILDILQEEHKSKILNILPLTEEEEMEMCLRVLEENSKTIEQDQLILITASEKTNNPFFLKTLINELCVAGRFRQLTDQIKNLLLSDGVLGLIEKILNRVKNDYQQAEYEGNVVEEVLCALCLCKGGISESEFPMPQHLWAPVIYALNDFLIDKGGVIGSAFPEMSQAIENVFMKTNEQKQKMIGMATKIFYAKYKGCVRLKKKIELRPARELLYLLESSEDSGKLLEVLSDIRIFEAIIKSGHYELNSYWQSLGTNSAKIAHLYLQSLDTYVDKTYSEYRLCRDHSKKWEAMDMKAGLVQDLREWFERSKMYYALHIIYDVAIKAQSSRPGLFGRQREKILCELKHDKACFLSETEQFEKAVLLHSEVLRSRMKLIKEENMAKEDIAKSYHGIGLCYQDLGNFEDAEKCYLLCLETQGNSAETSKPGIFCNLGLISMENGKVAEAIERFEKSNALIQEAEPNKISLEIAYNYHNLGLAYRKLGDLDTAEKYYQKSLKVKKNLLGQNSMDVAQSLMNLGTLEVYRKNNEKSLEYAREALKIFEITAPERSLHTIMARENVINQLTTLGRYEEAEPFLKEACASLKTVEGGFAKGLLPIYRRFMHWYISKRKFKEAGDIASEIAKCSRSEPQDFALLALVDAEIPPAERPTRPQCASLDAGLQKWPESIQILCAKLDSLTRGPPEDFMTFVSQYCGSTENRYIFLADILKDKMRALGGAIEVLKEGVKIHPGSKTLANKLATIHQNTAK